MDTSLVAVRRHGDSSSRGHHFMGQPLPGLLGFAQASLSVHTELQHLDEWQRQTRSARVTDARIVDQTTGKATVSFTLMSVDDQNGKAVPKAFQGTWQLIQMDGKWRLDTPSVTQVG